MTKLSKYRQLAYFPIWAPRYHDKRVLLDAAKVDRTHCDYLKIRFTKAKSMPGEWVITRKRAKQYKKESNGSIICYCVPLEALEPLEIEEHSILEI